MSQEETEQKLTPEELEEQKQQQEELKALLALKASLKKKWKEDILFIGLEQSFSARDNIISTGSLGLDLATGIGGWPRGKLVEIFGPESSGKTTLALMAIAEAQKQGVRAAFCDAEHALDPSYARALGVDTSKLVIYQPDHGEQALEVVDTISRSGLFGIIVVDSIAALVPKKELDGEMGDSHMGLHARLMSQFCRKITGVIKDSNTLLIMINQTRSKIGVVFGSPETTTGGRALRFYASIRARVSRSIKKELREAGTQLVTIETVKNKLAPPFQKTEAMLVFGKGIDRAQELLDLGMAYNQISLSGSWYTCGDEKFHGQDTIKEFLSRPEEDERLTKTVRELAGLESST